MHNIHLYRNVKIKFICDGEPIIFQNSTIQQSVYGWYYQPKAYSYNIFYMINFTSVKASNRIWSNKYKLGVILDYNKHIFTIQKTTYYFKYGGLYPGKYYDICLTNLNID